MSGTENRRTGPPLKTVLARLVWVCVLPLVVLATWLAYDSVRAGQVQRDREAANLAKNFTTSVDQYLEARIRALHLLAISPLLDDETRWGDLYREAEGFRESFSSHVILADVGAPMRMLFNTRVPFGAALPLLPRPRGHAAAPTAVATGKPAVGDSFFGPLAREPLVAVAVPAVRDGKPVFVLVTTFETSQFQARLDQFALPEGWAATLRDGRGDVIARRAPPGFDPVKDVDPNARFVARSTVSPWSVALEVPRAVRRAPLIATGIALSLGVVGATLVGVVSGLRASRRLSRAVGELTQVSGVAEGADDIAEIGAVRRRLDASASDLRASEANFRAIFDSIPDAIVFTDGERCIRLVNPAFTRMFGYTADEAVGRTTEFLYSDPAVYADVGLQCFRDEANDGACMHEVRYRCKDGREFWAESGGTHIVAPDGGFLGFMGMHRDITRRRQAEDQLRLWAESFRQAELGLAIADARANTFVAVNPAFARARGYAPEELAGQPVTSVFPPDLVSEVRQRVSALDEESHGVFESEHLCRDGRRFPVLLDVTVLRDAEGRPEYRVAYALDLTERKRAERDLKEVQAAALEQQQRARIAALNQMQDANAARARAEAALAARQESEAKLQAALSSMSDAIFISDTEGRFIDFNDAFATFHRFRDKEECAKTFAEYPAILDVYTASGELAPVEQWAVPRALRGEAGTNVEYTLRRKDTGETWVGSYSFGPIRDKDGEIVGSVVAGRDITEKKRGEAEIRRLNADLERRVLERTAELTAANQELDSFAYAVSHDLRAPLRAMSGFSQALVEDFGGELAGEAKTYLAQIGLASQKMGDLIDGILALSRSARGELRRDTADLTEMARRLLAELARREPDRRITTEVEVGLVAKGDARMLEAVLSNLLDNAWKYTERTSEPTIRVYAEGRGGERWFCVADNGAGFDMAHAERLFKPFQRLHRQDEFSGIGIGLATVQRIVHRHGGEIVARGEPGRGATFCFRLAGSPDGQTSEKGA